MDASLAIAKPHSGLSATDAKQVADVLVRLAERDGKVTPETFLEAATPPDSPIHDLFEWNDTVAAVQHRLHQARQIVRSIVFRPMRAEASPTESVQLTPARIEARRSIAAKFTPAQREPAGKTSRVEIQQTSSSVEARERYVKEIREAIEHPASAATFEDLARAVWDAGYTFARLTEGRRDTSYDDFEDEAGVAGRGM